jgi:hypothetical protein
VNDPANIASAILARVYKAPRLMKDFLIPVLTFFAGLFGGIFGGLLPHVQKPLTDYRKTLSDISAAIIRNTLFIYGTGSVMPLTDKERKHNAELKKCYDALRAQHARLLASASTIPRFARPILRKLGLLRSQAQIETGAQMLIGISNEVIASEKDRPHLTECIKKLGAALDIAVK